MAIINTKAALVIGTNYKLHVVDFQGTDIGIDITGTQITSSTTDFTASSEAAGIVKRAVAVGDILDIRNTTNAANEGFTCEVTSVAANALGITVLTGSPVDEVAGADINIQAFLKQWEFLEAGGLDFQDGVDAITWVSEIVDLWDTGNLDIYPKMFTSIEPRAKSMAALNGWEPLNADTLNALRNMAMEIRADATAQASLEYACARSGSLHETADQFNFWHDLEPEMNAPTAAVMQGYINQMFLIVDRTIEDNDVEGATQANPVSIQSAAHNLSTGDIISFQDVVGMTELNGLQARVTVTDANNFTLDGVDGTGFTAYTSGGTYFIDKRGTWNFRCLEHGKTHLQEQINVQFAEIYPVASNNDIDPKLADPGTGTPLVADGTISAGGIYANILLNVDADEQYDGNVDGSNYTFRGYVDQDSQTNQTLATKVHYLLRQATDINDDGTGPQIRGDKHPPITLFSGDLLTVDQYYPLNFNASERNNLQVIDTSDTTRSWPKVFTLTITSPALMIGGTFSVIHKDTYGTSGPTYLQNEGSVDQQDIAIAASVDIIIAYSTYNVGGHTANTPIPLVLTWNKPGSGEPDFNDTIVMGAANQTVAITPTADPSYVAA